ncbi:MAG: hypothetical protein JXA49_09625 [Actinobacteria bacterium]|nr:hypothetical protein [Actinomycetota bacterium]
MESVAPSNIKLDFESLSTKQKNAILSIVKDIGFTPMEIGELVIKINVMDESLEPENSSL